MPVVLALARGVETDAGAEFPIVRAHGHLAGLAAVDAFDREELAARQPERLRPSPSMNWSGRTPIIRRFER